MKTNINKISAIEQFQKGMKTVFEQHYHQALSDNVKRAWKLRRERLSTSKVAM
jgi:hypothetical protein